MHELTPLSLGATTSGQVHQFAGRYYSIQTGGNPFTIDFAGQASVAAIPAPSLEQSPAWWSRRGDSIDSKLTRPLDLRAVDRATLHFTTWFDIERNYDFGYLEVSVDGGNRWELVKGTHGSDANPLGIAFGPAYTGTSGGAATPAWIEETADLTPFAGKQILLRFEYVTDESANRDGWAIRDLSVPEAHIAQVPTDDGAWQADGFVRLDGSIEQHFIVQAVTNGAGTDVQRLKLDENNHGSLSVPAGALSVTVIVSGTTDGIRTPAEFQLSAHPA